MVADPLVAQQSRVTVYLGPGSKIIGGNIVGKNAAVGVNSVVTRFVPVGGVIVDNPGEVVSTKGSYDYLVNTVPIETA